MASRVDILILLVLLRSSGTVDHIPQMTITDILVAVPVRQIVFWKFENDRNQRQQFLHNVFRNHALELLDCGTVLVDDIWMAPLQLWQVFEDVVHFDVITQAGEEFDSALGSVAGVVALFEVCAMGEFFGVGEGEEVPSDSELVVDFVLR